MRKKHKIWIAWEDHRRSRELANSLNCKYFPLTYSGGWMQRYIILCFRTLKLVLHEKSNIVVCQNPSIVLTFLLCCMKYFLGFKLVVDRHTNFKFKTLGCKSPKWICFHFLSKLTVKKADLTIVTNEPLKKIIEKWGGRGFVLQDRLPVLNKGNKHSLAGEMNIAFVCTFSEDEPYEEIISNFNKLSSTVHLYVTGDFTKWEKYIEGFVTIPDTVHLLGFIDEEAYQSLIKSVDIVMVITNLEYILNCGAYEAIAVDKPLILSDTKTIRSYFKHGVVYTHLDKNMESLFIAIEQAIEMKSELVKELIAHKPIMIDAWEQKKQNIEKVFHQLKR